jgi:hypothetical protein
MQSYYNLSQHLKPIAYMDYLKEKIPLAEFYCGIDPIIESNWCSETFQYHSCIYEPQSQLLEISVKFDQKSFNEFLSNYSGFFEPCTLKATTDLFSRNITVIQNNGLFEYIDKPSYHYVLDVHSKNIHDHIKPIAIKFYNELCSFEGFLNLCDQHNLTFNGETGKLC